jgi:CRISPR-associated endonuclease/helicase Cas3
MRTLLAKSKPEFTPLKDHLEHVSEAAVAFARYLNMDRAVAHNGALLHDIGKAHPVFQNRLLEAKPNQKVFRHEIASVFFLSAFPENEYEPLIEMVVGHHKSVKRDVGEKGLLDLEQGSHYREFHLGDWDEWSPQAFDLLNELGVECTAFSKEQAFVNLEYTINYCKRKVKERGYSEWRGLLMGADHFASALIVKTNDKLSNAFKTPNLNFFNRQHILYPLSYMPADSPRKHSIVVACTGAGKTDYLFRRTKGRVFYTLPFQASINAMYKRVANDLEKDNPLLDIRVLHASSSVVKRNGKEEETVLQSLIGSSIKVLTPHQLAAIAFGLSGYEALILDLKGCDIILDEIHTYTDVSQAIVLKLVQILKQLDCRIHIGTATMPTALYQRIAETLGEDLLEIKLENEALDQFDRHVVHKIDSFEASHSLISEAISNDQKVLIVFNRVDRAQNAYMAILEMSFDAPILLLHSRFKRSDRNDKEKLLIGLDQDGNSTGDFNTSEKACIVISTQIVEVSLDISFDIMITETAPLDALIQRFGRVNRKRTEETLGKYKSVYIIAPTENKNDALPYDHDVLLKSYEILNNGEVLKERELQAKIDVVFPEIDFLDIEEHAIFRANGTMKIDKLTHRNKSHLFNLLEIDSVSCVEATDIEAYENGDFETRLGLEIPVRYYHVKHLTPLNRGNKPFPLPGGTYSWELGLQVEKIKSPQFDENEQVL